MQLPTQVSLAAAAIPPTRQARWPLHLLMLFIGLLAAGGALLAYFSTEHSEMPLLWLLALLFLAIGGPVAAVLHKPRYRAAATVFCVALIIIWFGLILLMSDLHPAWLTGGKVELTLLFLLIWGLPTASALAVRTRPWGKYFALAFATVSAFTLLLALIATWFKPETGDSELWDKMAYTAYASYVWGGIACVLLINVGRDRRYFRWPAVAAGIVAIVCSVILIWYTPETRTCLFTMEIAGTFVLTLAFLNMLLMTKHSGLVRLMQIIAITLVGVIGILGLALCTYTFFYVDETPEHAVWIQRFSGGLTSFFILANGSILCLLIARAALRLKKASLPFPANTVEIKCPNCATTTLSPLTGACPHCLLGFRITLTEPRCQQCDHILLNTPSERCPECGHPIDRPSASAGPAALAT